MERGDKKKNPTRWTFIAEQNSCTCSLRERCRTRGRMKLSFNETHKNELNTLLKTFQSRQSGVNALHSRYFKCEDIIHLVLCSMFDNFVDLTGKVTHFLWCTAYPFLLQLPSLFVLQIWRRLSPCCLITSCWGWESWRPRWKTFTTAQAATCPPAPAPPHQVPQTPRRLMLPVCVPSRDIVS